MIVKRGKDGAERERERGNICREKKSQVKVNKILFFIYWFI